VLKRSIQVVEAVSHWLFTIDVLAGFNRADQQIGTHLGDRGVEERGVARVIQRGIQISGRAFDFVLPRQCCHLLCIAANQDRVGHHAIAIWQRHAALLSDRYD
jgi:hypothetical protein